MLLKPYIGNYNVNAIHSFIHLLKRIESIK